MLEGGTHLKCQMACARRHCTAALMGLLRSMLPTLHRCKTTCKPGGDVKRYISLPTQCRRTLSVWSCHAPRPPVSQGVQNISLPMHMLQERNGNVAASHLAPPGALLRAACVPCALYPSWEPPVSRCGRESHHRRRRPADEPCNGGVRFTCTSSLRVIGRSPHLEPLQLHALAKRLVVHRLRTPPQPQRSAGLLSSTYTPVQRSFAHAHEAARVQACICSYVRRGLRRHKRLREHPWSSH